MYFVGTLLGSAEIKKLNERIAGEDAWSLVLESSDLYYSCTLLRSEIMLLMGVYEARKLYMTEEDCFYWGRLFSVLD